MEEAGIVSLWLGRFESLEIWEEYLETNYSLDGDFEGSHFTKAFNIDYYDEDFKESEFYKNSSNSLNELLKGFSYDNQIVNKLKGISIDKAYNTVLLLYNFRYDGTINHHSYANSELFYIGQTDYSIL